MDTPLTIGRLARTAGVSTSAVRYYERAGLITPAGRTAANYRYYETDALERLRFIRAAQASGFRLQDVTKLLRPASCGKGQGLIEERLDDVGQRMKELRRVQRVLRNSLKTCKEHEASGRCRVVENLSSGAGSKAP